MAKDLAQFTIEEILEKYPYPEIEEIIAEYGLHCVGCALAKHETLEHGIVGHGFSEEVLDEVISKIKKIIKKQDKKHTKSKAISTCGNRPSIDGKQSKNKQKTI